MVRGATLALPQRLGTQHALFVLSVSDGVDAPTQRHLCAKMVVLEPFEGRKSMEKISIIGLDVIKHGMRTSFEGLSASKRDTLFKG